ncbi:MAG TPA: putative Ig domain-containing protein [Nitrospiraceae bacterium]
MTEIRLFVGRGAEGSIPSALAHFPRLFLAVILGLGVLTGCSSEPQHESPVVSDSQPGRHAPTIKSASVTPNPVIRNTAITVALEKDPYLTYGYQWFINQIAVQGETTATLNYVGLRRGDVISVEVTASNAQGERAVYRTPAVMVANSPPTITRVVLEHDLGQGNSRLIAKVEASDADQDDVRYVYLWLRNGTTMKEGPENVLDTVGLARKDIVTVEVTAYDLDGPGAPSRAIPLVVDNNPPSIISHPMMVSNTQSYEYTVQAKDSDGDPVTFALEISPPGMRINQTTGRLVWNIPPTATGTHHVKIMAMDGQGGRGWQEFDLAVPATVPISASKS